ncbi:PCGF6 protein, partial [Polypterus senegalus]|nr:polycomb group RING finger protein 6 isoform X1 [Polypterus senegalus]MBN3291456.1 PCGF6 protein [Polypterus senegalus]
MELSCTFDDDHQKDGEVDETDSTIGVGGPELQDSMQPSEGPQEDDERTISITDVSPFIRCTICTGFFIEATTITECLHTFCKSCIVKHFFYSNRCPKCNVVVHQTQPLYNIRLDRQLQDIVYKLVPNLERNEKKHMHEFYKERGLEVPKLTTPQPCTVKPGKQRRGLHAQSVFRIPPELDVSLLLEFVGAEEGIDNYKPLEKKFVRVSGDATIRHVELFIRRKMGIGPACQVDVICGDHLLESYRSLRDIQKTLGESSIQDGLLVLHFGLVLPPGYKD